MGERFYLIFPFFSAFAYAVAAMAVKRAIGAGMGPWRIAFLSNVGMFLAMGPLYFWGEKGTSFLWWPPLLTGLFFFAGQVMTFLTFTKGDVSVATPIMGAKVVFVALGLVCFLGERLTHELWMAVFLTVAGIGLFQGVGGGKRGQHRRVGWTIMMAVVTASLFSAADVMSKHWCPLMGFGRFASMTVCTVMILSLTLIPLFNAPLHRMPEGALRYVLIGVVVLALQALSLFVAIGYFGKAAEANVIYAGRGVWSVVLVWVIGHWFANEERHLGIRVMVARMAGAALILAAVVMVILAG